MDYVPSNKSWPNALASKLHNFSGSEFEISQLLRELIPNEAKEEDYNCLASVLLHTATISHDPNGNLLLALKLLFEAELISWATYLNVCTEFTEYRRWKCLNAVIEIIRNGVKQFRCPVRADVDYSTVGEAIIRVFEWIFTIFENKLENDDPTDTSLVAIISTLRTYTFDVFVYKMLQAMYAGGYYTVRIDALEKVANQLRKDSRSEIALHLENALMIFKRLKHPQVLQMTDMMTRICQRQKRSGIRSLTAVVQSFRLLASVSEVADTIMMFARIFSYDNETMVSDFLHASILVLIEEHELLSSSSKVYAVNFFFVKMPKILKIFTSHGVQQEHIINAVKFANQTFRNELNALDSTLKDNSITVFCKQLQEEGIIDSQTCSKLIADTSSRPEHFRMDIQNIADNKDKPLSLLLMSKNLKTSLEKGWDHVERLLTLINRVITSGHVLFDSFTCSYCVTGGISDLTFRMVRISLLAQDPIEFKFEKYFAPNNFHRFRNFNVAVFDMCFLILSRVAWTFPTLTFEELVVGRHGQETANLESALYKWFSRFMQRIRPNVPSDSYGHQYFPVAVDPEQKMQYKEHVLNLRNRVAFWDVKTQRIENILELVPIIGEVWLDEFAERRGSEDAVRMQFMQAVRCLQSFSSMLLCLVQWLESQSNSAARISMARCILESIDQFDGEDEDKAIFTFCRSVCRLHLDDLLSGPLPLHPVSFALKSIATRVSANCKRLQIPDANLLKDGWIYSQRQNWFSCRTLILIDHCNRSKQHRVWIRLFINNMMKLGAPDCMGKATEFISAILLLDPVDSLCVALENVFDFLFKHDDVMSDKNDGNTSLIVQPEQLQPGLQHDPTFVIPLVKLATQILMLSCWIAYLKQKQHNEVAEQYGTSAVAAKKSRQETESYLPVGLDSETNPFQHPLCPEAEQLMKTVRVCVECMNKECKSSVFTPSASMTFHIVKMIARAPQSIAKRILTTQFPLEMLFRMIPLDPCSSSLEMFSQYCNGRENATENEKLRYLCMVHRYGGLPSTIPEFDRGFKDD